MKTKQDIIKQAKAALIKAAEAQEDLAKAYQEMEWNLTAESAAREARELRYRAEKL